MDFAKRASDERLALRRLMNETQQQQLRSDMMSSSGSLFGLSGLFELFELFRLFRLCGPCGPCELTELTELAELAELSGLATRPTLGRLLMDLG